MFKLLGLFGVLLLCAEVSCVDSNDAPRQAERRVINSAGMEYVFQQQLVPSQSTPAGYSPYVDLAGQSTPATADLQKNVRTIILMKKVPVPYPVHIEKKIPYPVKVPIRRPYVVYVPRPYQVEVMKQVPVPVKVPYPHPFTVEKHIPVPYKVHYDKPYPVHINKPYPVYFEKRVPIHIDKPVPVHYRVAVDRPIPIRVPMEKPMLYPVERPYHFPIKVPVEKPLSVQAQVDSPYALPVTLEKPQIASEQSAATAYQIPTQPTPQTTFSPSPYDELTSNLLTQGKHKVISFLPGSSHDLSSGSFADNTEDVGTIHVSDIKNGGNSTDWVPKYVPNNQYLTYIPSDSQNKFLNYVIPEKTTKLNAVNPSEPFSAKPTSSVKMHYKLHFDPVKQEYSFQLVPKITHSESSALTSSDSKQETTLHQNSQNEFVYNSLQEYASSSGAVLPTQSTDVSYTYDYSQLFKDQSKSDLRSIQAENAQALAYAYQSANAQHPTSQKQEHSFAVHGLDSSGKSILDGNSHNFAEQPGEQSPKVSFTYQTVHKPSKEAYSFPLNNNEQPHVTYTYQASDDSAQTQVKNNEVYPQEQVKYMYIPQEHSNTYSEVKGSHLLGSYSISHDRHEHNTEFPQLLYHQGKGLSIFKQQEATQPSYTLSYQGGIPENYKTSRTSESLALFPYVNGENGSAEAAPANHAGRELARFSDNVYEADTISQSISNDTENSGVSPTVTFEKFNYNDVMIPHRMLRTKLYPVNESASEYREDIEVETSRPGSDYELRTVNANYFQTDDSTTTAATSSTEDATLGSEDPALSTKEHARRYHMSDSDTRSSSWSDESTRSDRRDDTRSETTEGSDNRSTSKSSRDDYSTSTRHYEEINSKKRKKSATEWYEMFATANHDDISRTNDTSKDTNSHTGAARRTPFYGYTTAPGTSLINATTTNSLQPPDDDVTPKPRSRTSNRGSMRAFGRRKESGEMETTTTEETPSGSSASSKRKRRPARRRMDHATSDLTTEEYKA
ncbi:unnamed protein product [Nesidiocoris tenuis]|uniref:Uncharacterized protein n=1 Tax=Nesidiocoris tenuis TaxID=355587 RepID=A0A6H5FZ61_9HEMI|nr:unnamed protein product [Nesidiocoris tenuis]